jgi:hypothetical protein
MDMYQVWLRVHQPFPHTRICAGVFIKRLQSAVACAGQIHATHVNATDDPIADSVVRPIWVAIRTQHIDSQAQGNQATSNP